MSEHTYAPRYHIYAGSGWINDPNGLIYIGGKYHAFYQFYPDAPEWGPMHWGHVSSDDLAHWTREPVALKPDQDYEQGCFSGSAADDHGVLTLVYTAHDERRANKESQCIARSFDGGHTFVKSESNPVIAASPEGFGADFRDPKVWKQGGEWRMVVGCTRNGRGCALLYGSADLVSWQYLGVLAESDGTLGSMWECPNYCRVDGQDLLILSPMEMAGHKNIALFGSYENDKMTLGSFQELDLGEDFYAAQVFSDGDRMILMAWMDMWGKPYPSQCEGWAGALTIPRVLRVQNGVLLQEPAPELKLLREKKMDGAIGKLTGDCLELRVRARGAFTFAVSDASGALITLSAENGRAKLVLPSGRISESPIPSGDETELIVYVDRSSIECFVNGIAFTQRIYPRDHALKYDFEGEIVFSEAWSLADAFAE